MSSLEIAEITGKRHDHVLRDITKMLTELGLAGRPKSGESSLIPEDCPNLDRPIQYVETSYKNSQNKSQPLAIIDKELTFTLLSRYSFKLSNMIVKRWLELEGSGFERVSIPAAVIHLVEREKDNRRVALQAINRGRTKRTLSPAEKEQQKWLRAAKAYEAKNPMR